MNLGTDWVVGVPGVLAFVAALLITPLVVRLAHHRGWVAQPKDDRWHRKPTALMGGLALYVGVSLALLPLLFDGSFPWVIWLGASFLFAAGAVDDLQGLTPTVKLLIQILCTGLLLAGGHTFAPELSFWISVPLTFVWVIGITNALNLLDNMDGLAAGTAAIAASAMAVFAALTGAPVGVAIGTAVAGAAFGFLRFNFNPARIFMGDSGSFFLGFLLAALAIDVQESARASWPLGLYLVSIAVLAVPIFDTTFVTVVRILSGHAVSQGGRDHTSHRLVIQGLTERAAVLTLYSLSALCGGLALVAVFWAPGVLTALLLFMLVGLATFGFYLGGVKVERFAASGEAGAPSRIARLALLGRALLGPNWKFLGGLIADLLLVVGAFVLAHELRFEEGLTAERQEFVRRVLPLVVVVKIPVFFLFGLYRGIWKYAGTPELLRITKAVCVSSVAVFGLLAAVYGIGGVSKGVAVIDGMIVLIALAGVRLGFRGARQYVYSQRQGGRRVLLYGAGDAGLLALREIRQNEKQGAHAVGFLDDDPLKVGLSVQGIGVLGQVGDLRQVCQDHKVEEVLITHLNIPRAREAEIVRVCSSLGIRCGSFEVGFELLR